jgi:hypothetical protein
VLSERNNKCVLGFTTSHEFPTNKALLIGRIECPMQVMGDNKPSTRALAKFYAGRDHECRVTLDHVHPGRFGYATFCYHLVGRPLAYRILTRGELARYWENLHEHGVRGVVMPARPGAKARAE